MSTAPESEKQTAALIVSTAPESEKQTATLVASVMLIIKFLACMFTVTGLVALLEFSQYG